MLSRLLKGDEYKELLRQREKDLDEQFKSNSTKLDVRKVKLFSDAYSPAAIAMANEV